MTLRPSSILLRVPLPAPPESSLPEVPDPESDRAPAANPCVSRLLATTVTDPSFESAAASALVAELLDFPAACRLDYATALVAESASASPPSVWGECALGTDVLEDRQEDFECLAAAVPRFASMLLAPEGDLDAPNIPTLRSYAEAITVDGMWIFKVKRPLGSPPAFKARYVARGFSKRQGADYFHTFSPTPKMTTLWVLLHVAAQRDYELHSLDFSMAFLQGSLHQEIWLRHPPGLTETFPAGTQWSLRRPVYGLRQAPREWHDTLWTTLAALGFAPATVDPSLFLRTDTSLPPFFVLLYIDDIVFATADTEALTLVKSELQKRQTCTVLCELRSYLGLQITRDRAWHNITLTQSHMVHQVLQRFDFQFSLPQPTPLSTSHSLSAPPSDESVEPSGPYPELVGCLITSGMGLVLGGRGPVFLCGHADASWAELLRSMIGIFDLDYDAILSAMYALSASAEGDYYPCVPPDLGIDAAALGASESVLPGSAPAEALHSFTLDSGASRYFFCYSTTHTPLPAPFPVRLADPSGVRLLPVPPLSSRVRQFHPAHCLVAPPCSCRLLSHQTLLWHHRLGHPSLPRLRGMHSRLLVSSLPRSMPPLPPLPAPPCLPCVKGRQRAAPHSSSFPQTTAPQQTLHMDVKGQVDDVLIPWIRAVHLQLRERLREDLQILHLHSDRGGEFSSDRLRDFCRREGILQPFTHLDSPQQNGISKRRIGLVMEVARSSMIHAVAPLFQWSFAVRYAAHQLNLWPRVSLSETSPTLRWTGKVGDASVFQVYGSRAFVRNTFTDKLSARTIPCVFLGFTPDAPGWQFYHPTSRRVFPSQDVTFDESAPFYRLCPYRSALPPPTPLFLAPGPPPVDPLPPPGPAPSGVSQVDPLTGSSPVEVAVVSGAAPGATYGGAASGGAEPGVAQSEGAGSGGAELKGEEPEGAEPAGVVPEGAEPKGFEPGGAESEGAKSGGAEPQGATSSGVTGDGAAGAGGVRVTAGAGGIGRTATTGPRSARTRCTGAVGTGGVGGAGAGDPTEHGGGGAGGTGAGGARAGGARAGGTGAGGAGAGGAGAVDPGGTVRPRPPHSEQFGGRLVSPVHTARRVPCSRPPPVPGTHAMVPDPESDHARTAKPIVSRLLATAVSDPSFESTAAFSLVAELVNFAAAYCLDYASALVVKSESPTPPSVGGECSLGTDILEERQEELKCLAAAIPRFASMLLAPEGDPDAPDIPTPRSDKEAITGVDYFQTFSPTLKRTTLRVLLHVAAQRDYELHYLDFSTAFLQGSLHKEFCYLDLQITRDRARRTITLTRSLMVHQVLQRFGFQFSSPQPTPLSTSHSLSAPPSDESLEPSGPYPELVGCLMHRMTCTRPDLAYPLCLLARYVAPTRHQKDKGGPVFLTGHTDASWVDDSATQRSSQGYTFSLGSGSVSWRSTRSSLVLSSSCEDEIYTGGMAAQELRWLTYLLTDLGEQPHLPPVLYLDSKAMIALCQEHRLEHITKHIAL
ncbi:unnamed protein product [Closterium sp. NIES-54]